MFQMKKGKLRRQWASLSLKYMMLRKFYEGGDT